MKKINEITKSPKSKNNDFKIPDGKNQQIGTGI